MTTGFFWRTRARAAFANTARAALAAALLCAAPGTHAAGGAASGDIVIGQVVDQSGINLEASRDYVAGAKTYFDHVNSSGGVNGHRLVLLVRDDGGVPERTLQMTRDLLENEHAQVLFGYVGDGPVTAVANSDLFRSSGVDLMAPLAGEDVPGSAHLLQFIRAPYRDEIEWVFRYFSRLTIERFAMVRLATPFAEGAQRVLRRDLAARSMKLYGDSVMASDGRDAARAAREIMVRRPQVIFVVGDTIAVGNFIRAYRPLDPAGAFIVALSNVNHTALLQLIGPALAQGLLLTQVVPNPADISINVVREHASLMRRFRDEPPSHLTLEGFLAAKALVTGLRGLGKDVSRKAVTAALQQRRHFDLDGVSLDFADDSDRGSHLVDLTLLRKDGSLLR